MIQIPTVPSTRSGRWSRSLIASCAASRHSQDARSRRSQSNAPRRHSLDLASRLLSLGVRVARMVDEPHRIPKWWPINGRASVDGEHGSSLRPGCDLGVGDPRANVVDDERALLDDSNGEQAEACPRASHPVGPWAPFISSSLHTGPPASPYRGSRAADKRVTTGETGAAQPDRAGRDVPVPEDIKREDYQKRLRRG